jgi:F0F1-type ATP synthase membrane subunit b/b'
MEKVWEELKKIDAQAEQIRSEAQTNAKEITSLAQKEAEALIANSKNYAQQEAQHLYTSAVSEANRSRDQQLEANQKTTENLIKQGQQRMKKASLTIVTAVLGET